jgi:sugar phosphate isomerase/epimerase
MRIGVFTLQVYGAQPLEQALDDIKRRGLEAVELGAGNLVGTSHCDPARVLDDDAYADELLQAVAARGLEISALSVHGNQVHPDPKVAETHDAGWRLACRAAKKLGIDTVIGFSGLPGDMDGGKTPNWITCPWPPEFTELLNWQWEQVLIPYWREAAKFAEDHGVRCALEMHPGMAVYNNETLLHLRSEAGPAIGANFDPSHLFWQGIDPVRAVRELGKNDAIFHVHAKDTYVDQMNVELNGVNDAKPYTEVLARSWTFRSVGYGHGEEFWRAFVSELRMAGYDGVLSIEHEDVLMSLSEGLDRAIETLKAAVIVDQPAAPWFESSVGQG